MATPHIKAEIGDFAKTVLMPGDPLRAKYIADTFLTGATLVNNVRGIHGYTGKYKDIPVSVMASGMGMPSMGIYSYELYKYFNVENIIRVGSAGAISDSLELTDIVLAQGACTDSNFSRQYKLPGNFAPLATYSLLEEAVKQAKSMELNIHVGNVFSSDVFYDDSSSLKDWDKMGVLAVEMEAAALYMNAARLGRNALTICTISDCPFRNLELDSTSRQNSFNDMIKLALEVAINL